MFVEISLHQNNLYKIVGVASEKRDVKDRITIPIKKIVNLTDENKVLLFEHLTMALPCIEKVDEDTYNFIYDVENVKALKIKALQDKTRQRISSYMPDWKLNRLKSYSQISKKVQEKGIKSLDEIEKAEYDVFPNADETHEQCQQYASSVLQWVYSCIKTHGETEQKIIKTTDISELDGIDIKKIKYPKIGNITNA